MADEWFYARDGQKHGPLSPAELRQFARDGTLLPTDLIWKQGMAKWVKASSAKDLFPAPTDAPPPIPSGDAPEPPAQSLREKLATKAKAAGRLAALTAEKTKLLTVALPTAYVQLGRYFYEHRESCGNFQSHLEALDKLAEQVKSNTESVGGTPPASTLAEKARAAAQKGVQFAVSQKLALQQTERFRQFGRAVFESLAPDASPVPVVATIRQHLDRLSSIEAELADVSPATPSLKRWLFRGAIAAAALVALFMVGSVVSTFSSRGPSEWEIGMNRRTKEAESRIDSLVQKGDGEWDAGKKLDAVATYIELMEVCDAVIDPRVLDGRKPAVARGAVRAIDSLVASGNSEAAKKLILIAHERKLTLAYSNPKSNALAASTIREQEARDKEAERRTAAMGPSAGGSFSADSGGFGGPTDGGDFFGGSGPDPFKPDGADPFKPDGADPFNPDAGQGFAPSTQRKAAALASRIRAGMTMEAVAAICGGVSNDRMPFGKGQIWLYELSDGSSMTVTFDWQGHALLASDVTDTK